MNRSPRSFAWPVFLGALSVAVLATAVYTDFDRVRVRLVVEPRPAVGSSLIVPLREQDRLAGLPVAVIARVRAAAQPAQIVVALDGRPLADAHVDGGDEVRIDASVDLFPADAGAITVSGPAAGWSLTYLETATVHGYAGPPLNLMVAPRARTGSGLLPRWALLLLLAMLVALRPRTGWPTGRMRYVYRPAAGFVLLLFVAAILSRWLTPYSVLLSTETFLWGLVVLYAEPLTRLMVTFRRRFFPDRPQIPELSPLPPWREVLTVLAALTVLVAIVLHPQVRNMDSVPDLGDPLFSMWRIAWVLHQLVNDPVHLFDANIFHPAKGTLTYSDSIVLPALTAWPLLAGGLHPVFVYNLLFLSGFVLSGVATYVAARSFGWRPIAAWTGAAIFTLYSFRIDHYSHLELQMAQWMPLALLGVHRVMLGGGWRSAALIAAAVGAQWYSSMYYALFLSVYLVAFASVLALSWRRWWRLGRAVGAVVLGAALALPLAVAYSRAQDERGARPIEAVEALSAVPGDYFEPSARSRLYAGIDPQPGQSERQLFPGVAPVALAVAGAWPPLSVTRVALLASGAVAFDGSLGLNGLLYPWFYEYLSPFQSVRVPARFAMLVGLSLAFLSAAGVHRWLAGLGAKRGVALGAAVTLAVAIDAWPSLTLVQVWREPPSIYASLPSSGAVLMEYPLNPDPAAFPENIPFMYFSIWHLTPTVNGYSGFTSPGYAALARQMKGFPGGETLRVLQNTGVTHISVVCALDVTFGPFGVPLGTSETCAETIRQLDADPRVRPVVRATWQDAPALLYELQR